MKEFQYLLDYYSLSDAQLFSGYFKLNQTINIQKAESFLDKYWLLNDEFLNKWKPIQDTMFCNLDQGLPAMVFENGFEILVSEEGSLFDEQRFEKIKKCILACGDDSFVVIQNDFDGHYVGAMGGKGEKYKKPALFNLKFPASITWQELMSGDFISAILCGFPMGTYLLYGYSKSWAFYVDNEVFKIPLQVVAFKSEFEQAFRKEFSPDSKVQQLLNSRLPEIYLNRL